MTTSLLRNRKSLDELSNQYGLDKNIATGFHDYIPVYESLFEPLRNKSLTLLEIGIGVLEKGQMTHCQNFGYRTGNSLRCWRDYFAHASIHGIDIDDAKLPETSDPASRIRAYIGDQSHVPTLKRIAKAIRFHDQRPTIDIIIDDGSHLLSHQVISFSTLSRFLSKGGGLYIIEDVSQEYQPKYRNLSAFPDEIREFIQNEFSVEYYDRRAEAGQGGKGRCQEDFMVVFRRL